VSEPCCDHGVSDPCCDDGEAHPTYSHGADRLTDIGEVRMATAAGLLLAAGFAGGRLGAGGASVAAYAAGLVVGGWTFIPQSLRGLVKGRLGVGTLMTIGAIGAVVLGELAEAATLAFLFSISEALEAYALSRTRRGLRAVLDLVPKTATVLKDGLEMEVPPEDLRTGDRLVLRPGERLATDGTVIRGRSTLDLSAITGESVPVEAVPGDDVLAGSINGGGALEIEVTATSEDNSLARIVRIVEEAQERKSRSQRIAERVARPLVPAVLVAAAGVAGLGSLLGSPSVWVMRSLVIVVAAAPCAFAISVPVAVVAAVGAATRSGVLIKGGAALEALGRATIVAIDKTGTLTRNEPRVLETVAGDASQEDMLALAAALEARSEHPLAGAILAAAEVVEPAVNVQAIAGKGLIGAVGGEEIRLGRPGFVSPDGVGSEVERLQQAGATVVLVERSGRTVGAVAVRDELRPEAHEAIGLLHRHQIETVMLTGDNASTARALARDAGLDRVEAELVPEEKAAAVKRLKARGVVAMVGDGINDAPALASADCGIAVGTAGADVAIEAADVALMGEDLRHLPDALLHARRAMRIVRQNLALSATILLVLIPLAATGIIGLAAVVAVHELAEVVVIANGVRAARPDAFATRRSADPHSTKPPKRQPAAADAFLGDL
jgi:cation-transporting P-type ATPase G